MQQKSAGRVETESASRRGWQQGATETTRILLQLMEMGYERRKINQLMAIYDDHFVSEWLVNNLKCGHFLRIMHKSGRKTQQQTEGKRLICL